MGTEVQNEKATTSLRVCSLGLLRDWRREARVRDEGPGIWLERPGASPLFSSLSYLPLHSRLENSREDLFAVRVNVIFFIDVGRVIALTAVNYIQSTVGSEDLVIAVVAEQVVFTETAIYAVVTGSATYRVGTTAAVAIVVASQTPERVFGTEPVDPVFLIAAFEVIGPKSAP
jgi:hypothetical protein